MKTPTDSEVKDFLNGFEKILEEETETEKAVKRIRELNEKLQTYEK